MNLWGIPVLYITGGLSIIEFLVIIWISLKYPALVMNGNPSNIWWIPAFLGALIVIGLLIYYIPRYVRQRQGVNINFVYQELPPE